VLETVAVGINDSITLAMTIGSEFTAAEGTVNAKVTRQHQLELGVAKVSTARFDSTVDNVAVEIDRLVLGAITNIRIGIDILSTWNRLEAGVGG